TGIPIMAWAARSIVPLGPGMWRWIFVLGSAGIPLILVVARYLPESARWLAENGDVTTADAIVTGLEREAKEKLGGELPAPEALPIVVTG
ncbi:MFS transporter, partial [Mycobacterium kansasii]